MSHRVTRTVIYTLEVWSARTAREGTTKWSFFRKNANEPRESGGVCVLCSSPS
jgi:hypothetical protein